MVMHRSWQSQGLSLVSIIPMSSGFNVEVSRPLPSRWYKKTLRPWNSADCEVDNQKQAFAIAFLSSLEEAVLGVTERSPVFLSLLL